MKKAPVVIKGNKSGIRLVLDKDIPFDELQKEIADKFESSAEFLGNAQVAISFEGRELSEDEEAVILQCISEHSNLDVVCVIDNDKKREEYFTKSLNERLMEMNSNSGQFFKGNLRSGQVMEFETSIIILGDVNAGAQVVSTGNVIILGALNGTVYAGASGRQNCFVVALKMNPMQIRIGDVIARSSDEKTEPPKEPQIAYLDNGRIYVDTLSRKTLTDIHI
ncbi:MAG: septum site-determining protein MinC [Eubacterium sp.]|nr:septum site-determining protein MinC [Eubacterium sp.]